MAKKYKADSLYFTDRKAYYAQKIESSEKSNDNFDFSNKETIEKMVGFAGSEWSREGGLGRSMDIFGINSSLKKRFPNLTDRGSLYTNRNGYITIQEAVWLSQRAWEEFQLFRNTIEAMVEFSLSEIKVYSKNKSAKAFCEAWLKAINIDSVAEQFYREMYRSCNVFINKIYGEIHPKDVKSLKVLYGSSKRIPVKYTILNPAQIALHGGVTSDREIYKVLSPYEIKRLASPKTEGEKILYQNLDEDIKKQLKNYQGVGNNDQIYVKLENTDSIFYQKQEYEYFAVPLFYGVLDDIELKLEMKKADKKILSTVENMILLVTMGGMKGVDGEEVPPNPDHMAYVRQLFNNTQAKRVLVADFTTKVQYVIPDIAKVVGESKYKQVNQDIREGLQSVFGSDEKFSNQMTKVRVFIERLKGGQKKFIRWIVSEMQEVCREMGFSDVPSLKLSTISLEDATQLYRVYTRLCELGILTPMETINAIENGILPNEQESVEDQDNFKNHKDKGRYVPQIFNRPEMGNQNDKSEPSINENGRPEGSGTPIDNRAARVVGSVDGISLTKFQSTLNKYDTLKANLSKEVKKHYKIEKLSESHVDFVNSIAKKIVANSEQKKWNSLVKECISKKEIPFDEKISAKIEEICENFDIDDDFFGALIYHSSKFLKK